MMLNRTLLLSAIAVAVFVLLSISAAPSAAAEEKRFNFDIGKAIILGQGQSGTQNTTTIRGWFRQTFNNMFQDDTDERRPEQRPVQVVVPPASQVQPPKPLTAEEIRQSQTPNQGRTGSTTGTTNTTNAGAVANVAPRGAADESTGEVETSTQARLRELRGGFFPNPTALEAAADETRRATNIPPSRAPTPLVPSYPSVFDDVSLSPFPTPPSPIRTPLGGSGTEFPLDITIPSNIVGQPAAPRGDLAIPGNNQGQRNPYGQGNTIDSPITSPQTGQQNINLHNEQRQLETARQVLVSTSPRLVMEVEPPDSVVIGQEGTYRIRITNIGDAPAEEVVVQAEIPSWIDIRHRDASDGGLNDQRRDDGSGLIDLEWKINRMNPGITNTLILGLVPHQRQEIKLPIRHDFKRTTILATVNVREPQLEMELIGGDEVLWNETVIYRLLIRNVGNGDAENVRLDLLQTSAGESFHEFSEPLRPGETRELDIRVQAGREREHIDITVAAAALHNVKAEVNRRIRVLRPRLEMTVQTLPLHFVDNPAEFTIRVRNVGTADAENVVVRAELPLGMQYRSSNDGGVYSTRQQQNIVEWRGKTIARGEMQTFTLVSEPKREGNSRISVETTEPSGDVLVSSNTTFMTEAIVDLDLIVHAPRGPIELGQDVKYEIQITNSGTKAADNVEVRILFGHQFTPTATHGNSKAIVTDDGQVAFEVIPSILPKQDVTLNVVVRADGVGVVPIRAEVIRADSSSGAAVSLQKGLSAHIFSRTATAPGQPQDEVFR